MKKLWLAFVAFALYCPAAYAALDVQKLQSSLDAVIDGAVAQHQVVGTVVLVAENGKIVYHHAAGEADREAHMPMREEVIFRLASMSKPLVSATALALVDDGLLSLDDPVTKYLPYFTPKLPDGTQPAITIRQLLTHTAGLGYAFLEAPDGAYHKAGISDGLLDTGRSAEESLRLLAEQPLHYAPGTAWGYSLATDVLGEVIAKAADKPLPQVVAEQVTTPLGMAHTDFTMTTDQPVAAAYADGVTEPVRMPPEHYAVPFGNSALEFAPKRLFNPEAYPSGGAGMAGTAGDYLAFLEALRKGGAPILKPETTQAVLRNQTDTLTTMNGDGWGWGLAASVLTDPAAAKKPMGKGTMLWGGVYGTNFWMDRENGLSVVIMTNTAVAGTVGAYPRAIRNTIYAAEEPHDR